MVERYLAAYSDDLRRIWAVERPFELHTDDGLLSGRADVILNEEGGATGSLAIVEYALGGIRDGSFPPKPEQKKCAACDYREVCGKRATQDDLNA